MYAIRSWLYVGEGQSDNQPYAIKEYKWLENFEPREIKSYGEQSGLTKKIIEDYLNEYATKIANLELNKHPFFFIVITSYSIHYTKLYEADWVRLMKVCCSDGQGCLHRSHPCGQGGAWSRN